MGGDHRASWQAIDFGDRWRRIGTKTWAADANGTDDKPKLFQGKIDEDGVALDVAEEPREESGNAASATWKFCSSTPCTAWSCSVSGAYGPSPEGSHTEADEATLSDGTAVGTLARSIVTDRIAAGDARRGE
jgi:hypothetical protein